MMCPNLPPRVWFMISLHPCFLSLAFSAKTLLTFILWWSHFVVGFGGQRHDIAQFQRLFDMTHFTEDTRQQSVKSSVEFESQGKSSSQIENAYFTQELVEVRFMTTCTLSYGLNPPLRFNALLPGSKVIKWKLTVNDLMLCFTDLKRESIELGSFARNFATILHWWWCIVFLFPS